MARLDPDQVLVAVLGVDADAVECLWIGRQVGGLVTK